MIKEGKEQIKLLHSELLKIGENVNIRKNFTCVACGNIPMAPVK